MNIAAMKQKKWGAFLLDMYNVKIVMLMVSFIASVPYFNQHLRIVYQIVLIWGLLAIGFDFFTERKCFKNPYAWICFLFCVSNGITALLHYQNALSSNISKTVYIGFYMFGLFAYDVHSEKEKNEKEILGVIKCVIGCTFVLNLTCLLIYLLSINGWYWLGNTETYWIPIGMYHGRMWGVYNPNTGGAFSMLSILLTIIWMKWKPIERRMTIFLKVNVIVQFLALAMGQSRTALIQLLGALFVYLFFIRQNIFDLFRQGKAVMKKCLCYVGILAAVLVLTYAAVPVLTGVHWVLKEQLGITFSTSHSEEDLELRDEEYTDISSSTSGRGQFWEIGVNIWKEHKVWGIGSTDIFEYAYKGLSEERILALKGGGLHSVYVTTLVASGIVGTTLFGLLLILSGVKLLKGILFSKGTHGPVLALLVMTMLVGELLETRILYGKSTVAILFWIVFGYALYFTEKEKKELEV